jgi:hypothetical protein
VVVPEYWVCSCAVECESLSFYLAVIW